MRREDGTCWTCAKPHCLGAVGHMLGRLGYATRAIRHAQPTSLGARFRLVAHDLVLHALLNRGTERCEDCGHAYPLWYADNWDWAQVMGHSGGLLCPNCFLLRGGFAAYARRT